MRTAAGGPRGEPHPLARRRSVCLPTAEASESSLDSGGGGRRRRASEHDARSPRRRRGGDEAEGADAEPPAPPTPAPSAQRRPLNPAHALLLREARQGSAGGRLLPEQVGCWLWLPLLQRPCRAPLLCSSCAFASMVRYSLLLPGEKYLPPRSKPLHAPAARRCCARPPGPAAQPTCPRACGSTCCAVRPLCRLPPPAQPAGVGGGPAPLSCLHRAVHTRRGDLHRCGLEPGWAVFEAAPAPMAPRLGPCFSLCRPRQPAAQAANGAACSCSHVEHSTSPAALCAPFAPHRPPHLPCLPRPALPPSARSRLPARAQDSHVRRARRVPPGQGRARARPAVDRDRWVPTRVRR